MLWGWFKGFRMAGEWGDGVRERDGIQRMNRPGGRVRTVQRVGTTRNGEGERYPRIATVGQVMGAKGHEMKLLRAAS